MRIICQRKVKKIGDSYHVSLPIQWVRSKKLLNDNLVTLKENDSGDLEILTGDEK